MHDVKIAAVPPSRDGALVLGRGYRAHCTCGWSSDRYAQRHDAEGASDLHRRRADRDDFDALIARSSIGAAIADVKQRGIEAHLLDLEEAARSGRPQHQPKPSTTSPRRRS